MNPDIGQFWRHYRYFWPQSPKIRVFWLKWPFFSSVLRLRVCSQGKLPCRCDFCTDRWQRLFVTSMQEDLRWKYREKVAKIVLPIDTPSWEAQKRAKIVFSPNFWSGLGSVGVIDLFEGPGIVGEVLGAPWGVSRGPMCRYWPEIPALDYNVNGWLSQNSSQKVLKIALFRFFDPLDLIFARGSP